MINHCLAVKIVLLIGFLTFGKAFSEALEASESSVISASSVNLKSPTGEVLSPGDRTLNNTLNVTYVFANINGRLDLLKDNLLKLSLINRDFEWKKHNVNVVLLGNITSKVSFSSDLIQSLRRLQAQAPLFDNSLDIVLGINDLDWISSSLEVNINLDKGHINWLSEQDFILEKNGEVFVNGGISKLIKFKSIKQINTELKASIQQLLRGSSESSQLKKQTILNSNNWPHKYLGNSFCHPFFEQQNIDDAIDFWNIDRIWSASKLHTNSQVESRFQQRMIFFDQDTNQETLFGAKIKRRKFQLLQNAEESNTSISEIANRHYQLPYGMNTQEIKDFLKTAKITSKSKTKEGRTKPLKVFLEKDGKRIKAIFKSVNQKGRRARAKVPRSGDKYDYEIAAYEIDQMLNLDVVPILVERAYSGRKGVMQLWIDDLTSSLSLVSKEEVYTGQCDAEAQENFVNTFDFLIMNLDRNQSNILFTKNDWQIWFIDHSRSFGSSMKTSDLLSRMKITPTKAFKNQLNHLRRSDFDYLNRWLSNRQIEQVWKRRNRILNATTMDDS